MSKRWNSIGSDFPGNYIHQLYFYHTTCMPFAQEFPTTFVFIECGDPKIRDYYHLGNYKYANKM